MKRWMAPLLMTLSLSSFVFAEMNNDNLTQAFEKNPRFNEYNSALKSWKEEEDIKIAKNSITTTSLAILTPAIIITKLAK